MHVSAKGDYAVRAVAGLALVYPEKVSAQALAETYDMPKKFLEAVLGELRRAALVGSSRGPEGGYTLRRSPEKITVGEVLRVIDGPLADVRGLRPDEVSYSGNLRHIQEVWVAARSAVRSVFDEVTFDQVISGQFSDYVQGLFSDEESWLPR